MGVAMVAAGGCGVLGDMGGRVGAELREAARGTEVITASTVLGAAGRA
jgi:hypothetical protein